MKIVAQATQGRDLVPEGGPYVLVIDGHSEERIRVVTNEDGEEVKVRTLRFFFTADHTWPGQEGLEGHRAFDSFDLEGAYHWSMIRLADAALEKVHRKGEEFDTGEMIGKRIQASVKYTQGNQGVFTNLRNIQAVPTIRATAVRQALAQKARPAPGLARLAAKQRPRKAVKKSR